jgi:hypothetical protein
MQALTCHSHDRTSIVLKNTHAAWLITVDDTQALWSTRRRRISVHAWFGPDCDPGPGESPLKIRYIDDSKVKSWHCCIFLISTGVLSGRDAVERLLHGLLSAPSSVKHVNTLL